MAEAETVEAEEDGKALKEEVETQTSKFKIDFKVNKDLENFKAN